MVRGFTARTSVGRTKNKTIKKLIIVLFMFCPLSSWAKVSHESPKDQQIVNRIERYTQKAKLVDIYSYHTKTSAQIDALIERLFDANQVSSVDQELFEAYRKSHNQTGFHLVPELYVNTLVSDAKPSRFLQSDALLNPLLNEKEGGRYLDSGTYFNIEPRLIVENQNFISLDLWPRFVWHDDAWHAKWFQYALKLGVGNLELAVGKIHFQWGQGRYSRMMFGGSQKALPMVRLQNVEPVDLDGFLSFLGQGRFTLFVARMDENQVLPHSTLIGERIAFEISPRFELGLAQSIQIGGSGYPDIPWYENVGEVIGFRTDPNSTNFTNRNAQIDFRWKFPQFYDLNVFGELFIEDCCTINFDKNIGQSIGLEIPDLGDRHQTRLGAEFLRTTYAYNLHSEYLSGFIYEGVSLGHHIGSDSVGYYFYVDQSLGSKTDHELAFAFELRQVGEYTSRKKDIRTKFPDFEKREYRYRFNYTIQTRLMTHIIAKVLAGYERVQNFDYIDAQDENFFVGSVELGYQW
ncbi:MAG: hypothetical protein KDD46_02690 [Bdellovibrionales bacterium]|nr:hypothetical protein [Bdellovibrionales bacterium]